VTVVALALMFVGFVAVAASMERHQQELGTEKLSPRQRQIWRLGGWLLLALSIWPCLLRWQSVSVSLAAWAGLMTLAGLTLGLLFTYSPKITNRFRTLISCFAVRHTERSEQA